MFKTLLIPALAMLTCAVFVAGCSTGEPGVRNSFGTLRTQVNADPPRVTRAAEAVLNDLDLVRVSSASTEVDGEVVGYTASDKKVSVSIDQEEEGRSKLKVRVGAFGDEDLGLAVINRIEKQLGYSDK